MATNADQLLADLERARAQAATARQNAAAARARGEVYLAVQFEQQAQRNEQNAQALQTQYDLSVNSPGSASAGQVAQEDQQARANNATTQTPQQAAEPVQVSGRITPQDVETGTDAPVRTLTDTQAITEPQTSAVSAPPVVGDTPATPVTTISQGQGAASDDATRPSRNATRQELDNLAEERIVPQANVLDQYASYTYSASLYLIKPEALAAMIQSGKKSLAGTQLLIQSAGAPVGGRNPYFTDDYYIDRMTLKSVITGKGSGTSHNVNDVEMTVIEPNGITLLKNLDMAVQQYLGSATQNPAKKKNFSAQLYLLVIRFYGYDDSGNLIQAGINTPAGATANTAGAAFVEKYYPLSINSIKFRVANRLVEYTINAVAPKYAMNTGQLRASIPYNVELAAMTVREALLGTAEVVPSRATTATTTTATTNPRAAEAQAAAQPDSASLPPQPPPKATAAPNPKLTVRKGVIEAMNQFQLDLVKNGAYTYPDVYKVEFVSNSIEQALLRKPGGDKKSSGTPAPATGSQQLDPAKQSYDPNTRIVTATAGQQLVKFLDEILKTSSYIQQQQTVTIEEDSGRQVPNGNPGRNLAWYKISLEATPLQYDPKRNDYAYEMKYIIHPYFINEMRSKYFSQPKFRGVHKQYNYWFTGENTQVLSYEQDYRAFYYAILSGGPSNPYDNGNELVKWAWQTRSAESSQQAAGRTNEPAANAADYLYNPSDLATANLTIVGDPAWLQQGEAFATPTRNNFSFSAFLPDGTINYEAQQILFEILINTPGDYDLNTGLMDPNTRSVINPSAKIPGSQRQSYVYMATEVVSNFDKGRFTQNLKGVLMTYFQDQSVKAALDSGRNTTAAGTLTAGGGNTVRGNNNAFNTPDNEWTLQDGVYTLRTDGGPPQAATDDQVEELVQLGGPVTPDPALVSEPPGSNGEIELVGQEGELQQPLLLNTQPVAVADPDYNSGLAGQTSPQQLIAREA